MDVPTLEKKYGEIDIYESLNNYYFKTNDNSFYRVSKDYLDTPIKLFHFQSAADWKVSERDIMILSEDTVYLYTEGTGIKPIVKSKEFLFNYKNICNFYKK